MDIQQQAADGQEDEIVITAVNENDAAMTGIEVEGAGATITYADGEQKRMIGINRAQMGMCILISRGADAPEISGKDLVEEDAFDAVILMNCDQLGTALASDLIHERMAGDDETIDRIFAEAYAAIAAHPRPVELLASRNIHIIAKVEELPADAIADLMPGKLTAERLEQCAMTQEDYALLASTAGSGCAGCMGAGIDAIANDMQRKIDAYGHGVIMVGGETAGESYAYSVGLTEMGWPELLVTGLPPSQAQMIINAVVSDLRSRNLRPQEGMRIEEAVSVPLRLAKMSPEQAAEHLKHPRYRAREAGGDPDAVEGLQIVWPDTEGRFPGDPGYDEENFPQPHLGG